MTIFEFKVNGRRKYILIVLAILLLLGLIYRFQPFLGIVFSPGQDIELAEAKQKKYLKMVEQGRGLDKRLNYLNRTLKEFESGLLEGKTPSLAAAEIQKILGKITGNRKLDIGNLKVLEPEEVDQGNYLRVPVEISIDPDIRQLKEILYDIASSKKYLSVMKLKTKFSARKGGVFHCFITVAGFMKRTRVLKTRGQA
jgi:Tfp pilus assembly protein PilO